MNDMYDESTMVDGEFFVVSMVWHGPKKPDPELGFVTPSRLVSRAYDDVESAEEAFGKAYAACLGDFDEKGWSLQNHTVLALETMWSNDEVNEEEE